MADATTFDTEYLTYLLGSAQTLIFQPNIQSLLYTNEFFQELKLSNTLGLSSQSSDEVLCSQTVRKIPKLSEKNLKSWHSEGKLVTRSPRASYRRKIVERRPQEAL